MPKEPGLRHTDCMICIVALVDASRKHSDTAGGCILGQYHKYSFYCPSELGKKITGATIQKHGTGLI